MTIELKPNPDGHMAITPVRQQIAGQMSLFPGVFDDEMVQDAEGEWVWKGAPAESTLPPEVANDLRAVSTKNLRAAVARKSTLKGKK